MGNKSPEQLAIEAPQLKRRKDEMATKLDRFLTDVRDSNKSDEKKTTLNNLIAQMGQEYDKSLQSDNFDQPYINAERQFEYYQRQYENEFKSSGGKSRKNRGKKSRKSRKNKSRRFRKNKK
jgi:hypothetical protein